MVPTIHPKVTVHTAIINVLPLPFMTRLKMSLPKLSVPIQWARDGAWFISMALMAVVL